MQNPSTLIQRLIAGQVEFVLVGEFAAAAHGAAHTLILLEVCACFTPENLGRLQHALADTHPVHRMNPQRPPFTVIPELVANLENLFLATNLGVLNCLSRVPGVGDFKTVKRQSVEIEIPGGKLRVLDMPALITAKKAMGRPHDLLTVTQLQAILEARGGAATASLPA